MDVDAVVAGAGPVGLMLAAELRLGGASVLVLERRAAPDRALKGGAMGARSLNAPTVDAFARRGLLETVREAALWWIDPSAVPSPPADGREVPPFAGHFAGIGVRIDRFDPSLLGPGVEPPRSGGVIAQLDLEEILADRAAALGAEIRRGTPLTGLEDGEDGVSVLAGGRIVRARRLVGCDGGRSTVRALAGFRFPGTGAEFTGRQAMVKAGGLDALPVGGWVRTERGAYVHGPVPGRLHTVEYAPPPERGEPVTAEEIRASVRRVAGVDLAVTRVLAATRYSDAARQVPCYRRGRVLLAGDAAHIHSPAGGQGLNLGIGDAMNLGWKLAATVRGDAPAGLLDTYTAERHPVGAWVQDWSRAQSALGRPDPSTAALRAVMADLLDTPAGATYVLKNITGIGRGHDLPGEHPLTGMPAPDVPLAGGTTLDERCRDGRTVLVTAGAAPAGFDGRLVTVAPAGPGPSLLVRPDGHVAWAADDPSDHEGLRDALATWLGGPAPRPQV